MSYEKQYNLKSPGVKRLMREARELAEPTEEYYACPLEDNLFEWHFTVRGPSATEFEGGFYHGRILLPTQYPMQPPNIILLTPNGRFEINKKICLSISGHHPESWQPSWSIRTALLALIAFMPVPSAGTIGSLDYTPEERKVLATKSKQWECAICGKVANKLIEGKIVKPQELTMEETTFIKQISLKAEEEMNTKQSSISPEVCPSHTSETSLRLRRRVYDLSRSSMQLDDTISEEDENASHIGEIFWTVVTVVLGLTIGLLVLRRIFFH